MILIPSTKPSVQSGKKLSVWHRKDLSQQRAVRVVDLMEVIYQVPRVSDGPEALPQTATGEQAATGQHQRGGRGHERAPP